MKLLFLHGWGLDASLWDGVRAALPEFETVVWDRGYFAHPIADPVEGPVLAIGHSLGAMLLAGRFDRLVAVNGFDRFAGNDAVPPRVVERMRTRFAENPVAVLADFRARIGAPPAANDLEPEALAADLAILAEGYARDARPPHTLVLHGGADPLLPASMREIVFAGAPRETLAEGGHLLPLTRPDWVADHIRAFAA
ncbi:alpha/beta fold hydrolase [Sphingomonas sp. CGMCC 1.13654]|uniref:Alpha/beta fold hydrolase n=1 Tax=Sphingomonas chungangi TaxID=2683589 RepID=A0A838L193_9SPHN|nr:alpha/beta fold hydrolase [Sphingomonas chungangi]MBA2933121.1 alpha/beta fold hydrolase [Sphingomonas chungangi]MVW56741.1 alpha/beta fold hydrolase [Sphingomonas chungangi]